MVTSRTYRTSMPVSTDLLALWHSQPAAFTRLVPPWMDVRVEHMEGTSAGDTARVTVPIVGPLRRSWSIVHEALDEGSGFADVQTSGPFESWRHEHRFLPAADSCSILEDAVAYNAPFGTAGSVLAGNRIDRTIDQVFAMRHQRTRSDLARHQQSSLSPQHVLVSGATGLVARRLIPYLETGGHRVSRLVRRPAAASNEITWNPETGEIDQNAMNGVDAVVHLAGATIAGGRWTASRKEAIRSSRVNGTSLLARTIAALDPQPRVFISTSAVGYYGDRGSTPLTEDSSHGGGFLADVCRDWEGAAAPAAASGIRVVHPRFGVVVAGDGGMFPLLARLFQMGMGGKVGSGQQYMAWIALDDLVGVIHRCIADVSLEGPVNAVGPTAVTNAEFTGAMGRVFGRPTLIPAPAFLVRTALGELADELILGSQQVVPQRLVKSGFAFDFPSIEDALRFEFGRLKPMAASSP